MQNFSTALNSKQQRNANSPRFSITLCFGMDRVTQRKEKRRASFRSLRSTFRSNTEFAEALGDGFSDSYVSQLLSGHRSIGDEVADKIESRLALDPGWLDQDHSTQTEISPEDARFISDVGQGVVQRDIPEHVRQTILTLITSLPEKEK